jgi:hypothetical protein
MQARLGDLLHPKVGPSLGMGTDPWYLQIWTFLVESINYPGGVLRDKTPFVSYEGVERMEMVRCDESDRSNAGPAACEPKSSARHPVD